MGPVYTVRGGVPGSFEEEMGVPGGSGGTDCRGYVRDGPSDLNVSNALEGIQYTYRDPGLRTSRVRFSPRLYIFV